MSLPILGLRVRLRGEAAEHFDCVLEASFVDGTKLPPRKHLDVNRDALTGGHVIQDERKTTTLPPVAKAEWLAEGGKEKKGPRWGRKGRGNGNGR